MNRPLLLRITTVDISFRFFAGQSEYLQDRGFRVHAASSPGDLQEKFADTEGIAVHSVRMPRTITPITDLFAVRGLMRLMGEIRPIIVHSHTPKGGLLGMIAARLSGVPVRLYQIHGLPFMAAHGWKRHLLRATERVSCALAHEVICVSQTIRKVAIEEGFCPADKIKVILGGSSNGVDAGGAFNPQRFTLSDRLATRDQYGIPADAVVIGFVGRIVRDKGMVELAGAWSTLRERFPNLHLVIVGMFEPQDPVQAEVKTLFEEDPRIHLAGTQWDTPPLYNAMDIVCLPTYREGLPNVPLEAAAMELPVVATSIPGCVDAVQDGVTGTLVPPRNAEALAAALKTYINDPDLRSRHGQAGRGRVVRDFQREAIWEALYQEYCRLLREKGLPVPEPLPEEAVVA